MITLDIKYDIGERVFYALPDSDIGIVTDVTYRLSSNIIWYHVTFNPVNGEIPCRDFELTKEKQF